MKIIKWLIAKKQEDQVDEADVVLAVLVVALGVVVALSLIAYLAVELGYSL